VKLPAKACQLIFQKRRKMSSNIRLKKVCQHCKQPYIAKTTVTKFCSLECAQRNYKKRKKEQKLTKAILDTNQVLADSHPEKDIPAPVLGYGY
jgi:hypothetical protein